MRADFLRTEVQRLLTHEYVHLVLDEAAGSSSLPAWLNEGMARYYEYDLGLRGERPEATRTRLYRSADLARSAALSGVLLQLPSLESQAVWNSQTDDNRINLQYAESYMAVRFLRETFGLMAPLDVVEKMREGVHLAEALQQVTSTGYEEFQQRFPAWLADWQEPERAATSRYIQTLNGIMASMGLIYQRRAAELESQLALSQRVPARLSLVADAQDLFDRLKAASPPPTISWLHEDALAYLGRIVEWLTLELEYAQTGIDARKVQANNMIPEIDAREILLLRRVSDVEFAYHLDSD
jgi:hypothetical protein